MAFQSAAQSNNNTAGTNGNDNWKAQAFLNLYLPKPGVEGGRIKVGAIPLKNARKFDAKMIERLNHGGPEALQAFANCVEWDFQMADSAVPAELPF